eukprot:6197504-Pleurochrysis_carterae.AAC.3
MTILCDTDILLHSVSHAHELLTPSPYEPRVWRRRQRDAASLSPWARQPECGTATQARCTVAACPQEL